MKAPIICFLYKRPEKASLMFESLKKNPESNDSPLYIFIDGPKDNASDEDKKKISEIVFLAQSLEGFAEKKIIVADKNKGLAASVMNGVTDVVSRHGTAIVVEEDTLLSPFFLAFMNEGLSLYKNEERIFGIGAWTYFLKYANVKSPFFFRYPDSIAWAVYERSWKKFVHDEVEIRQKLIEKNKMKAFEVFKNISYFNQMLSMQEKGVIDSWAIRWTATSVIHDGLFLYPNKSLATSIGSGGDDGTHDNERHFFKHVELTDEKINVPDLKIEENPQAIDAWKKFVMRDILSLNSPYRRVKNSVKELLPTSIFNLLTKKSNY